MRWHLVSSCSAISRASPHTKLRPFQPLLQRQSCRNQSTTKGGSSPDGSEEKPIDPKVSDLGYTIRHDFAKFREKYDTPKSPIVLAHGLMGFDEFRLVGNLLPGIKYWRGITDAYQQNQIECITTAVPTTGSIEERAMALHEQIKAKAAGKDVNIVAHSMGGLDSRYLISKSYLSISEVYPDTFPNTTQAKSNHKNTPSDP